MQFGRRKFLAFGGAAAGAACGPRPLTLKPPVLAKPKPTSDKWDEVRAEFELDPSWKHFAGFLLAPHPRIVREAIATHRRGLDRNPPEYLHAAMGKHGTAAREAAARFLGVEADEIALTDSTTMGLGIVYGGFELAEGQEIVTTTHDHYSTHEALRFRAKRDGATLRKVPLFEHSAKATEAEIVERFTAAITPKTRLAAVTWVHSSSGMKLPLRAMADALSKINEGRDEAERTIFAVDGVHGFGIDNFQIADLGCDFFIAGTHKWMFGPRGTGIVWGKKQAWELVLPTIPAFERQPFMGWMKGETPSGPGAIMCSPGGFHSFEHRWALDKAFAFHESIGRDAIAERIHALNRQLKEGLAKMSHVELKTPMSPALSAGITTFMVDGMAPKAVANALREKKYMATTTPYENTYARLAPGLLNTPEEIEGVLAEINALA
jgi:selenocysteine lyase/cysteine desulfurase